MRKKYWVTIALFVLVLGLGIYSYAKGRQKNYLVYADSLDMVAAQVEGVPLTLRELGFYVAYEEDQVEQQALIYDEDTSKYWNARTDHTYIRTAARNAAIQMAIHDEIFYQMAMSEQIELSQEDKERLNMQLEDSWADLTDYEKEAMLGIGYEDVQTVLTKMAYAQKMQWIYAELHNEDYEAYEFYTDNYKAFLKQWDYKIYPKVWSRVNFGNVTLYH